MINECTAVILILIFEKCVEFIILRKHRKDEKGDVLVSCGCRASFCRFKKWTISNLKYYKSDIIIFRVIGNLNQHD